MSIRNVKRSQGFTLVEIAIVLILFGFGASTIALGLKTYNEEMKKQRTADALSLSTQAIVNYVTVNNRYPCPADPTDGPGDATYGYEVIVGNDPLAPLSAANPGDVPNIQNALDNIDVRTNVDLDGDGTNEDYVVGAVPFNTLFNTSAIPGQISIKDVFTGLDFSASNSIDGYGNKVTYAVSRHLCDPTTAGALANDQRGVLDVVTGQQPLCVDGSGNTHEYSLLPGEVVCKEINKRFAQLVLVSHGEDGKGAFTESGQLLENCVNVVATPPPPGPLAYANSPWDNGNANDIINCKVTEITEDAGDGSNRGIFFSGLRSDADNDNYYDDSIKFYFEDTSQMWQSAATLINDMGTPGDTSDDVPITRINNVNGGEVVIGDVVPQEILHVDGDVQAINMRAIGYCDDTTVSAGTNCLDANTLAGAGMNCPNPGEYAFRIENSTMTCRDPFSVHNGGTYTCPPSSYLKLIRSNGDFECCDSSGGSCVTYN